MATESPPDVRPSDVRLARRTCPRESSTCCVSADFRMTSTTLLSDVVLPAATWYEKHDLSTTDMHPFVHAFTPAIDPPWEAQERLRRLPPDRPAALRPGRAPTSASATTWSACRCSTTPRARPRSPAGWCGTGGAATSRRSPGRTMPVLQVVERDYTAIADKLATHRPARRHARASPSRTSPTGSSTRSRAWPQSNGVMLGGAGDGRPAIDTDVKMAEAILTLLRHDQRRAGRAGLPDPGAAGRQAAGATSPRAARRSASPSPTPRPAPVPVITSPEWSGSETGGRRYAPFTVNVERLKPWHTLTGRMHFFLDHDWMRDLGEALPIYRPPLDMHRLLRRADAGPGRREAGHRPLPDAALEVVDPLRVPGQPAHARRSPAAGRRAG